MRAAMQEELIFNGVNATTGEPLLPALSAEQVSRLACGAPWDPNHLQELRQWNELVQEDQMDVRFGIDPRKLEEAGWGVVFPQDCAPEIREALAPLLELRKAQAEQRHQRYYREIVYLLGESKPKFLARNGAGPGPADPENLPYYLLIVGSPEEISFRFQYQLDVQYAVGRIHFETAEEYAHYAEGVVAAENGRVKRPRRACFFGVSNPGDRATHRSRHSLVQPLADWMAGERSDWTVERIVGGDANKQQLAELLGGENTPALIFTASHGIGFDDGDPRQLPHQGALLCQDWPGPKEWKAPIPPDHYLSADDIADSVNPAGLIAFHFACYGAGTPKLDSFAHRDKKRRQIAPHNFLARLPQRLLGHSRGGALAVVGHVDRSWSYSFDWPQAGKQLQVFESTLGRLLEGYPVGAAMEYFNQRYAELSTDLSAEIEEVEFGAPPDFMSLSQTWTANNDARSYVIVGDPAVPLPGPCPVAGSGT